MRLPAWLLPALLLLPAPRLVAQNIVNVVPAAFSHEHEQNSEPNIAVNPLNSRQILISAFGNSVSTNPIYYSQDGGSFWRVLDLIRAADTTLAWSDNGVPYLTKLSGNGNTMAAARINTRRNKIAYFSRAYYRPGFGGPDQPWIFANSVAGHSHLFIGFNDLSKPARTASIRMSKTGGTTWRNIVIERVRPGDLSDGPPVRVAALANVVYAVFERFNESTFGGHEMGEVVVVKDLQAGGNDFRDLGADGEGVIAAADQVFPQDSLGDERIGSDLSIAVDPTNSSRVFVAYARLSGGNPQINVLRSTDGGAHWTSVHTTASQTALPAIAIASNGTVGLLFTRYTGGNLETHFTQSANDFSSVSTSILSRFTSGTPRRVFDPYIGDYQDLQAVGTAFFGTFSASNDVRQFPSTVTVNFRRDQSRLLTGDVPYSIDPYFFTVPAIGAP